MKTERDFDADVDVPEPAPRAQPTAAQLLSISPAELQMLIDEGVAAAMQDTSVKVEGIDYERMGKAFASGLASTTRRKVTIGEYVAKMKVGRSVLRRRVFQNGYPVQVTFTSPTNTEVDLLNQITHSGRYLNGVVDVVLANEGAEEVIHLSYNCATIDQRMENKSLWNGFDDLLAKIVAAQKEEDAEVDEAQPASARNKRKVGRQGSYRLSPQEAASLR